MSAGAQSLAEQIDAQIAGHKYAAAIDLCNRLIAENPRDTERQMKMVEVFIEFLKQNRGSRERRLRAASQALRFGHSINRIASFYFKLLDRYLAQTEPLASSGKLVIGLGPGRNGSTSLAQLLASAEGAFSTHEVNPMVYATPQPLQIRFHLERFGRLRRHYPLVAETSHWMLYMRNHLLKRFPDVLFIVLRRPEHEIVDSFERIKGRNNHWEEHDGDFWTPTFWDVCYPKYPASVGNDRFLSRHIQLMRYVTDYYRNCDSIPATNRLDIELSDLNYRGREAIEERLGLHLSGEDIHLNSGDVGDSQKLQNKEF